MGFSAASLFLMAFLSGVLMTFLPIFFGFSSASLLTMAFFSDLLST